MERRLVYVILMATALSASSQAETAVLTNSSPEVAIPAGCESSIFQWDGKKLKCLKTDLLDTAMLQRDYFRQRGMEFQKGMELCQEQAKSVQSGKALSDHYEERREECRKMGKQFDPNSLQCSGTLPSSNSSP